MSRQQPPLWNDLNEKAFVKIDGYLQSNKERSAWLKVYLEECRKKLGAACPEPTFVPKTPVPAKRGGRRAKGSPPATEDATQDKPLVGRGSRSRASKGEPQTSTRATRGEKRVTRGSLGSPKKQQSSSRQVPSPASQSVTVLAEPANCTLAEDDSLVASSVGPLPEVNLNSTFDVGQVAAQPISRTEGTFTTAADETSVVSGVSSNTTASFMFMEAEMVVQEQEDKAKVNEGDPTTEPQSDYPEEPEQEEIALSTDTSTTNPEKTGEDDEGSKKEVLETKSSEPPFIPIPTSPVIEKEVTTNSEKTGDDEEGSKEEEVLEAESTTPHLIIETEVPSEQVNDSKASEQVLQDVEVSEDMNQDAEDIVAFKVTPNDESNVPAPKTDKGEDTDSSILRKSSRAKIVITEEAKRSTITKRQLQNNDTVSKSDVTSTEDEDKSPVKKSRKGKKKGGENDLPESSNKDGEIIRRSTRTANKIDDSVSNKSTASDSEGSKRSTRNKLKVNDSVASDSNTGEDDERKKRTTRTKNIREILSSVSTEEEDEVVKRSTRTRQKATDSKNSEEQMLTRTTEGVEATTVSSSEAEERPSRSTRTKAKRLPQSVTSLASPRVRELATRAMSPSVRAGSTSPSKLPVYTGSPVRDRVKVFEQAMRDSAGLKPNSSESENSANTEMSKTPASRRRSSIARSLRKVSAARNLPVTELLMEQQVVLVKSGVSEKDSNKSPNDGPVIKKSPGTSRKSNSRAPTGKVVRPVRKVYASGGKAIATPGSVGPKSGGSGSSSNTMRSRSRLNLGPKGHAGSSTPGNMVGKSVGVTSFLPAKPKGPTLAEIQEQKDEERRKKEEKEVEAKQRREEMLKKKADEEREKREARIRRVQEARQKQENQRDDKIKKSQQKEKEEKLDMLKKREEKAKEDAERRKKENEMKLKEAEERRIREEEERSARQEKLEQEQRDVEKKQEESRRKRKDEEDRKKKAEVEKQRKVEEQKREEELRQRKENEMRKEEQKRKAEQERKRLVAQQERIQREREELRKMKEREAARQGDLNSTYSKENEKPNLNTTQTLDSTQTLNSTQTLPSKASQGVETYDMTPARHELPPEPLLNEDDYGLEDLRSDQDTDDEDAPRKQIPKWAEGSNLRTSLLKQCYMGPDLDQIFKTIVMPDLSVMFEQQRKRFFKRTSSACWDQAPGSFKHKR